MSGSHNSRATASANDQGVPVTDGHPLRLYNSMGRRTEVFRPGGDTVTMYSCGPTVYAFPHLGNMRPYVFADTLRRVLRWKGLPVRHVINITDVGHAVAEMELGEDKLEVAAARERRSVEEIAAFYTKAFFDDLAALDILPAHEYPRATAYVEEMIGFARHLEDHGFAYRIPSGLYFDTTKLPGYGALALIDVAGQREGARVEQVEGRRHKTDFALWRAEEAGQVRAMRWRSPWGWGAPGWHLECSVMSMALLGDHFDIHTGGVDHRELHHVNEIAQSEAYLADGGPWVRYWLHNEFLQLGAEKMAKSAGGAPKLTDLVDAGYHPMAYRLFLLGGHYRSQLDFTTAAVDGAQATLRRLIVRVRPLRPLPPVESMADAVAVTPGGDEVAARLLDQVDAAISTDLNTPQVLAVLQDALRDPELTDAGRGAVVAACDTLLGLSLGNLEPNQVDGGDRTDGLTADARAAIEQLIVERTTARTARDWARADEIRAELQRLGVRVTDTPDGPVWTVR
jgi:cysteinyl-tRNA synthetase